jgi:Arc/MetJ-type ribon-helix-helix transcriptional regulator
MKSKKTKIITFRVTESNYKEFKKFLKDKNYNASDFMREALKKMGGK